MGEIKLKKKPLIMLVEDSKLYQQYLIDLCKKNDYAYLLIDDGLEAIEILFTSRPDLILLDIQLPGMNGYDVCQQIRTMPGNYQTPIIFVSSNNKEADIVKGFELGGNDYVTKPFNEVILLSRIKNQLEQVNNRNLLNDYIFELEKINTELKLQKEHSESLASRDHLTGIYNRRYLQSTIIDAIEDHKNSALTFALALFDIDDFKRINDTYGHTCGDYVLKEVVSLIYQNSREEDILARWGGEEFILYMPFTSTIQAKPLVEDIRQAVEDHLFSVQGYTFSLTITCGLSEFDNAEDYDCIFNRVDEALYAGKETGKNKVVTK